jgi:micrococcal nuclease
MAIKKRRKTIERAAILTPLLLLPYLIFTTLYGPGREYTVCTRVIDGDTIEVAMEGRKEKVRLIGVDTPETKHPSKPVQRFGKEASAFTERMAEGKRVRLEFDWQERDKYGRLLAYVYLEDGTFLNAEIIRQGYGHAYTRYPYKRIDEFRSLEREAREQQRGLWAD